METGPVQYPEPPPQVNKRKAMPDGGSDDILERGFLLCLTHRHASDAGTSGFVSKDKLGDEPSRQ